MPENKPESSGLKDMQENKIERYLKENPVAIDYKLTMFDLVMINSYLQHIARIYNIDNHVGFVPGNLNHLLMKLQATFTRTTIEVKDP